MENNSIALIERRLSACDPALLVVTHEERRVISALVDLAKRSVSYKAVLVWTFNVGTKCYFSKNNSLYREGDLITDHASSPLKPLAHVSIAKDGKDRENERAKNVLLVLKDYNFFLNGTSGYAVCRALKDFKEEIMEREDRTTIVIVDADAEIPTRLEKVLTVIDYDLPTEEELVDVMLSSIESYADNLPPEECLAQAKTAARATVGLTELEAKTSLMVSLAVSKKADPRMLLAEKKNIIRKSGVLEYYDGDQDLTDVGGLGNLKQWLKHRGSAFGDAAKAYGLPAPKAMMLLGIPGTGKSLVAKSIGRTWGMPVLRMDIGSLFGSLVGESEGRMRKALRTAEAVAPAILWVDEVEKALGRDGGNDGGTSSRVFGNFLSWMSDKTAPVFVVCTANGVGTLPPEFLRAGRFDALFFVELPNLEERLEICKVVAKRRGRSALALDWNAVAIATEGFSGAEIEESFKSAMYAAFDAGEEVSSSRWLSAVKDTVPLSTTMGEELQAIRRWATGRTIPASLAMPALPPKPVVSKFRKIGSIT